MRGEGGVHGEGGTCMVKWGMRGKGGHVWEACMARGCLWQKGLAWPGGEGVHAGETATEEGSMHPTGMHSCNQC